MTKIVVLTPIKNEEWILDTFLKTTSSFADHILLADQNSDDNSLTIVKKYPKVDVIQNNSKKFNEAERQKLLINTARQKYGNNNILLAIDSDEIITYNSLESQEWDTIKNSELGTVLYFEKPTFFNGINKVIRYETHGGWPLGFVDNGDEHNPEFIHSTRIPINPTSPKLFLKEIKFLHCNLLSLPRQRSKVRYYCILERLAKTKPWYHRLMMYRHNYDYAKHEGDGLMSSTKDWTDGWLDKGILFKEAKIMPYYWFDREAVKLLQNKGYKYFWLEDIWDVDWNSVEEHFGLEQQIHAPPMLITIFREFLYFLMKCIFTTKKMLRI
ncbi:glycosyltransferase family 2 protein [Maribacter sp. 1_2014MBL_MicDiv]|uniref:glycosyltransferase family 2 protein n=1 Tax=Maribacter sp. 1_2014MBL_MicDiv TaxID=1644130 RepID=UPI0008F4736D|nr:glycosyltransferase family 2 protein [Maribacter sp. 1_2014MBL_MicDiv]